LSLSVYYCDAACWYEQGVNMAVHSSCASVVVISPCAADTTRITNPWSRLSPPLQTQTTTFTIIGARLRHCRRPISRVSGQRASGRAHAEAQSALLCSLPAPGTARERGAAALQDRRASPEPEQPEAVKASQVSPRLQSRPNQIFEYAAAGLYMN
ncbi:uncharacterized, partial [Tachysurus ichikawai]